MFRFLIFLLLIQPVSGSERIGIEDFRFWDAPDHTRIVIDLEKPARYQLDKEDQKIILDIENTVVDRDTYQKIFYNDQRIKKTKIRRIKNNYELTYFVSKKYKLNHFTLPPNAKYKMHRLVIDLYDTEDKVVKKVKPKKSSLFTVIIDAGHGGEDPGAIGYQKTLEKNITLQIAKKLAKKINQSPGMRAVLSRSGDYYVKLTSRINKAQKSEADMFISIHADSVKNRKAIGASVYTLSEKGAKSKYARQLEKSENSSDIFGGEMIASSNDKHLNKILRDFSRKEKTLQSELLARSILSQLSRVGPLHKKHPERANFVVLKSPRIPSVLVETAFISNQSDEKRLRNEKSQNQIVDAIFVGILKFANNYRR